jgi:hypothetical protein
LIETPMINSDPDEDATELQDADMSAILRSGAKGALVLAGITTAIVILIWYAFYLLVFVPRAGAP